MKKNARVIEISGITWLLFLLFTIICLFVGFVVFPGYVSMTMWNKLVAPYGLPVIRLYQGMLLWVIIALGIYLSNGGKSPIAFKSAAQLNEREIVDLMSRINEKAKKNKKQIMVIDKNNEVKTLETFEKEHLKKENDKENLWKRFYSEH